MNPVAFHTQSSNVQIEQGTSSKQVKNQSRLPFRELFDNINNVPVSNKSDVDNKKRSVQDNSNNSSPVKSPVHKVKRIVSQVSEEWGGSLDKLKKSGKKIPADYLPLERIKITPTSCSSNENIERSESNKNSENSDDDLDFLSPFLFFDEQVEKENKFMQEIENSEEVNNSDYSLSLDSEESLSSSDESDSDGSFVIRTRTVNIRERNTTPIITKRPVIVSSGIEVEGVPEENWPRLFEMNGFFYLIELISKGNNHCVYKFIDDEDMKDKVLKFVLNNKNNKSISSTNRNAEASYKKMQENRVPLPTVSAMPSTFIDTKNPKNGGFWLIEKMKEEVTANWPQGATMQTLSSQDKAVVDFVKDILTTSAKLEKEVVNDFFPRNVMRNKQGQLCVVDFSSESKGEKWEFETYMFKYLLAWSNRNEHVWQYLIADFPPAVAARMTEMLNAEKVKFGGAFPASTQLRA